MNLKMNTVTLHDFATFQVDRIEALTIDQTTVKIWLINREMPFRFDHASLELAAHTFEGVRQFLVGQGTNLAINNPS